MGGQDGIKRSSACMITGVENSFCEADQQPKLGKITFTNEMSEEQFKTERKVGKSVSKCEIASGVDESFFDEFGCCVVATQTRVQQPACEKSAKSELCLRPIKPFEASSD